MAADIVRASNAKHTVVGATVTAKDTIATEAQATVNDVQGLSASAQKAVKDSNGHPLAKYHSVGTSPVHLLLMTVYDTVTWKFPRASAIAISLIVSSILASQFVNFSRFVFRILWLSFASTATIEAISKLVTGRGIVRYFLP
jgi:hypothetical protein